MEWQWPKDAGAGEHHRANRRSPHETVPAGATNESAALVGTSGAPERLDAPDTASQEPTALPAPTTTSPRTPYGFERRSSVRRRLGLHGGAVSWNATSEERRQRILNSRCSPPERLVSRKQAGGIRSSTCPQRPRHRRLCPDSGDPGGGQRIPPHLVQNSRRPAEPVAHRAR